MAQVNHSDDKEMTYDRKRSRFSCGPKFHVRIKLQKLIQNK